MRVATVLLAVFLLAIATIGVTAGSATADHCGTVWSHNAYHAYVQGGSTRYHTGPHFYQTCHGYHANVVHTH